MHTGPGGEGLEIHLRGRRKHCFGVNVSVCKERPEKIHWPKVSSGLESS